MRHVDELDPRAGYRGRLGEGADAAQPGMLLDPRNRLRRREQRGSREMRFPIRHAEIVEGVRRDQSTHCSVARKIIEYRFADRAWWADHDEPAAATDSQRSRRTGAERIFAGQDRNLRIEDFPAARAALHARKLIPSFAEGKSFGASHRLSSDGFLRPRNAAEVRQKQQVVDDLDASRDDQGPPEA